MRKLLSVALAAATLAGINIPMATPAAAQYYAPARPYYRHYPRRDHRWHRPVHRDGRYWQHRRWASRHQYCRWHRCW